MATTEAAFASLGPGRCLVVMGQHSEAAAATGVAQNALTELKASPMLAHCKELLHDIRNSRCATALCKLADHGTLLTASLIPKGTGAPLT
jgi:hypothetical protein